MNNFQKIRFVANRIKGGARFCYFTYNKDDGTKSERKVSFGADIAKALEKRGTPINGKGNWHKGMTGGKNKFCVFAFSSKEKDARYIRGLCQSNNRLKIFKIDNITNLR